ncbi:hypothetical protein HUT17_05035 (plasmid) [Nocardiopsis flavescens]|nr:hypothetical protein HUT17_05035 [Nocardiopsis flavescens]
MTGICGTERLDSAGHPRTCLLSPHHDGPHEDSKGTTWHRPETTLARLRACYGHTHRIAWTGRMWIATHRDPTAPWRTEVEPTPEQLEERLRTRQGITPKAPPPLP